MASFEEFDLSSFDFSAAASSSPISTSAPAVAPPLPPRRNVGHSETKANPTVFQQLAREGYYLPNFGIWRDKPPPVAEEKSSTPEAPRIASKIGALREGGGVGSSAKKPKAGGGGAAAAAAKSPPPPTADGSEILRSPSISRDDTPLSSSAEDLASPPSAASAAVTPPAATSPPPPPPPPPPPTKQCATCIQSFERHHFSISQWSGRGGTRRCLPCQAQHDESSTMVRSWKAGGALAGSSQAPAPGEPSDPDADGLPISGDAAARQKKKRVQRKKKEATLLGAPEDAGADDEDLTDKIWLTVDAIHSFIRDVSPDPLHFVAIISSASKLVKATLNFKNLEDGDRNSNGEALLGEAIRNLHIIWEDLIANDYIDPRTKLDIAKNAILEGQLTAEETLAYVLPLAPDHKSIFPFYIGGGGGMSIAALQKLQSDIELESDPSVVRAVHSYFYFRDAFAEMNTALGTDESLKAAYRYRLQQKVYLEDNKLSKTSYECVFIKFQLAEILAALGRSEQSLKFHRDIGTSAVTDFRTFPLYIRSTSIILDSLKKNGELLECMNHAVNFFDNRWLQVLSPWIERELSKSSQNYSESRKSCIYTLDKAMIIFGVVQEAAEQSLSGSEALLFSKYMLDTAKKYYGHSSDMVLKAVCRRAVILVRTHNEKDAEELVEDAILQSSRNHIDWIALEFEIECRSVLFRSLCEYSFKKVKKGEVEDTLKKIQVHYSRFRQHVGNLSEKAKLTCSDLVLTVVDMINKHFKEDRIDEAIAICHEAKSWSPFPHKFERFLGVLAFGKSDNGKIRAKVFESHAHFKECSRLATENHDMQFLIDIMPNWDQVKVAVEKHGGDKEETSLQKLEELKQRRLQKAEKEGVNIVCVEVTAESQAAAEAAQKRLMDELGGEEGGVGGKKKETRLPAKGTGKGAKK